MPGVPHAMPPEEGLVYISPFSLHRESEGVAQWADFWVLTFPKKSSEQETMEK